MFKDARQRPAWLELGARRPVMCAGVEEEVGDRGGGGKRDHAGLLVMVEGSGFLFNSVRSL